MAPEWNSNRILLGQIQKNGITYYDSPNAMILMRDSKTIIHVKRSHSLFNLNLAMLSQIISTIDKAMVIMDQGQPTHFVIKNKHIYL